MSTTTVYLVGGPEAHKKNRWLAMTANKELAMEKLATIKDGQIKTAQVKDKDDEE